MQRNMDLVRKILLHMEGQEHGHNIGWKFAIAGYTPEQIGYHAHLMAQGGLIVAADATFSESLSPSAKPISITWEGHDFLAAARDDGTWAKAQKTVLAPAAGATWAVILEWLKAESLRQLGLS